MTRTLDDLLDEAWRRDFSVNFYGSVIGNGHMVYVYSAAQRTSSRKDHDGTPAGRAAALALCLSEFTPDASEFI